MTEKPTRVIISTAYLGPVQYYSKLINYDVVLLELMEHFEKQTYRNRCCIYGPNGKHVLTIPLIKRSERTITKDIKISYDDEWQKIHWRSIESAYRRSPFFEYFEDDFVGFYNEKKFDYLVDFNEALVDKMNRLLKIKPNIIKTEIFEKTYTETTDFRTIISPKIPLSSDHYFTITPYKQVFDNKCGFIENLSIVDLLFNQGPRAIDFI